MIEIEILIVTYSVIAALIYYRGRKMGGWFTGTIVAILWFVLPILWCIGWIAERSDDST